jgi:Na+/serine symporter
LKAESKTAPTGAVFLGQFFFAGLKAMVPLAALLLVGASGVADH